MENSESHGVGEIITHNALFSSEMIEITVINKISYGQGCYNKKGNPKKFKLTIKTNTTIWKIKEVVGKKIGLDPILIKLEK